MLPILKVVYRLEADAVLRLHRDLPVVTLRGAFGHALCGVLAHEPTLARFADRVEIFRRFFCPVRETPGTWAATAEPPADPAAARTRTQKDAARPFVMRGAFRDRGGRVFDLELVLMGEAGRCEALVDVAMEFLAARGLGQAQQICRVCKLASVPIMPLFPDAAAVTVDFLTPARLRDRGGECRHEIPFGVLFARLAARVKELEQLYGDPGAPLADWSRWGDLMAAAGAVESALVGGGLATGRRISGRTGHVMPLDGFVGTMLYQGDFAPLRAVLAYLPWVHVGKSAAFGCGWVRMKPVQVSGYPAAALAVLAREDPRQAVGSAAGGATNE